MTTTALHNERQLLLQVAESDEQAFHQLYRHYYLQLKQVLRKYSGTLIDDEGIIQQAFLRVWVNRDKLPEIENFRPWLYRIAYREFLNSVRNRVRYETRLQRYQSSLDNNTPVQLPTDKAQLDDVKRSIQKVVATLAPQRRKIYEMNRIEGLKVNEIAEQLSLSPQTVKNVLFITLKIIREHLIAEGYGPLSLIIFFTII